MKVTTLVPWYGSNRTLAENVGQALTGCEWVGVPFAGGMCELRHITARTIIVGDLHAHVIGLANVVADPVYGPILIRRLRRVPFHEWVLDVAQRGCKTYDPPGPGTDPEAALNWAENYFICAWMSRNGMAGTTTEFKAGLSVRWDAGGGDSATRWRSAVEALRDWQTIMRRCTFVVMDVFDFLDKVKDQRGHGIYCDPPFPVVGEKYKHKFTERQQRDLARMLASFDECRIVCRFYDHPLIRELYPESKWQWNHFEGRTQTNGIGPEVLLVRNGEAEPCTG